GSDEHSAAAAKVPERVSALLHGSRHGYGSDGSSWEIARSAANARARRTIGDESEGRPPDRPNGGYGRNRRRFRRATAIRERAQRAFRRRLRDRDRLRSSGPRRPRRRARAPPPRA